MTEVIYTPSSTVYNPEEATQGENMQVKYVSDPGEMTTILNDYFASVFMADDNVVIPWSMANCQTGLQSYQVSPKALYLVPSFSWSILMTLTTVVLK